MGSESLMSRVELRFLRLDPFDEEATGGGVVALGRTGGGKGE